MTPLRDGMNLVAKEFVAAQRAAEPGVLVLSRFAGAAQEMTGALVVNPFDSLEIAEAIHKGLVMSLEERVSRWQAMMAALRANDAKRWATRFVSTLRGARRRVGEAASERLAAQGGG